MSILDFDSSELEILEQIIQDNETDTESDESDYKSDHESDHETDDETRKKGIDEYRKKKYSNKDIDMNSSRLLLPDDYPEAPD